MSPGLPPPSPSSIDAPPPASKLALAFVVVFGLGASLAWFFDRHTGLGVFHLVAILATWCTVTATAAVLPRWRWRLRELTVGLALAALAAATLRWGLTPPHLFGGTPQGSLQIAAVASAVLAFAHVFLATFTTRLVALASAPGVTRAVPSARLLGFAFAAIVLGLLIRLHSRFNGLTVVEVALATTTLILAAETALRSVFWLYQPPRLRPPFAVLGESIVLQACFGQSNPWQSLAATFQRSFGVQLGDTWLAQLVRRSAAALGLAGLLAFWLSTAFTRVPVEAEGVLILRGEFQSPALPAGPHLHLPWPWARVALVPTARIHEAALGFERDLEGPVLWAEKHFDGEQNMLVGQGEDLLTLNVPIHYRIRDAVAFLRHTPDAAAAINALGYRELLRLTTTHRAFGLMTTERGEVAALLHQNLQTSLDRLQLGLEIVYVGLKDVHPPVPVVPAFQDVVSAEEEHSAIVDRARTYAQETLAAAHTTAHRLRSAADADATSRLRRAEGESFRFLAPLRAYRDFPAVFSTRLRLEAIESGLAGLEQLWITPAAPAHHQRYFIGPSSPAVLR